MKTGHQLENVACNVPVRALIILSVLICGSSISIGDDSGEATTSSLPFVVCDFLTLTWKQAFKVNWDLQCWAKSPIRFPHHQINVL
jgi:hypothetical protein